MFWRTLPGDFTRAQVLEQDLHACHCLSVAVLGPLPMWLLLTGADCTAQLEAAMVAMGRAKLIGSSRLLQFLFARSAATKLASVSLTLLAASPAQYLERCCGQVVAYVDKKLEYTEGC